MIERLLDAGLAVVAVHPNQVKAMRPKILALVGVTLYPIVVGQKITKGGTAPGIKDDVIEGARVFVLPNPSGLNASFPTFADKVPWFVQLREFAEAS